MSIIKKFLPVGLVEKFYVQAGATFGDAVSYIYMGECVGFRDRLAKWAGWEQEYSSRGYTTISLDDFIGLGGYNKPITHLLRQKRGKTEPPIHHAQIFQKEYLGKIPPVVNLEKLMETSEPQVGAYIVPSTKKRETS